MSARFGALSRQTRVRPAFALLLAAVAAPGVLAAQAPASLAPALEAEMDAVVARTGVPGLTVGVAMVDGGSLGLAAGLADTAAHRAMRHSDRMLQGSVGKTYFAAVALQLVSEGRLDLDAPVAVYLGHEPWFDRIPNGGEATVRQLMGHTSGIVRYELNPAFLEDFGRDPARTWTPEERLSYLFDTEAPFAAGQGWEYSDTNYILLAMIIERVTGELAYDQIRERLLGPLDLDDTVPSDSPEVPGLVQGYAGPRNPFGTFDETLVDGRMALNPQFEWGGGGFASTAQDLARWILAVHRGRAFDPDLLPQVREGTEAPLGPGGRYGLGVIMLELPLGPAWGHSGFMPGYRAEAYYFPDHGFALALQINTSDGQVLGGPLWPVLDELASVVAEQLESSGP